MKITKSLPVEWLEEMDRLGISPGDEFFFLVRVLRDLDCSMETRNEAFVKMLAAYEKAGNKFCTDVVAAFDRVFTNKIQELRDLFANEKGQLVTVLETAVKRSLAPTEGFVERGENTVRKSSIIVAISGVVLVSVVLALWNMKQSLNLDLVQKNPILEKVTPNNECTTAKEFSSVPEWLTKIQVRSAGGDTYAVRVRENATYFEFIGVPGKWMRIELDNSAIGAAPKNDSRLQLR